MYKAYLFDLDGTLVDTLDSLVYSVNATMREMGKPEITRDQCRSFVGNGARFLIRESLLAGGETDDSCLDEAMRIYGRIFDANCTYGVTPYDGVVHLLEELKRSGAALAVVSNKPHRQAVRVTEAVFGTGFFDWIAGQREDVPRKPHPGAALQAAQEIGASASETVYIGDSEVDLETGTRAGMKTVLVSWGFRTRTELEQAGASLIADTAEEILELTKEQEEKNG